MKIISIEKLSDKYQVRKLGKADIGDIYELSIGNSLYFHYCPPMVTMESILDDMNALPPNMTIENKFYIGFYENGVLVAIMDLITNYPNEQAAFIGLFMVNSRYQNKGIGSTIIQETKKYLKAAGFECIRLAHVKDNPQSKTFWKKNHFIPTGEEFDRNLYTVAAMQCVIAL